MLNVVGVFVISAPHNFLVQRFQNVDSKDLGLWDLGMKNGRSLYARKNSKAPGSGRIQDSAFQKLAARSAHERRTILLDRSRFKN